MEFAALWALLEPVVTGAAVNLSSDLAKSQLEKLFGAKPELLPATAEEVTPTYVTTLVHELATQLEISAHDGEIEIDGAVIATLQAASISHDKGTVLINDTEVFADQLTTGGGNSSTGTTNITGNTELSSRGTSIKLTGNASIKITGNAQIRQN